MIRPETFFVRKEDERPARMDGTCFYCRKKIGTKHKAGCVIRSRTVVLNFSVIMIEEVPVDWTPKQIEDSYNEGGWCGTNLVERLENLREKHGCLCNRVSVDFFKEANEEDEAYLGVEDDDIEDNHDD